MCYLKMVLFGHSYVTALVRNISSDPIALKIDDKLLVQTVQYISRYLSQTNEVKRVYLLDGNREI